MEFEIFPRYAMPSIYTWFQFRARVLNFCAWF